nr:pantoate--beta-alanine ligase [Porphyromonas pogonae]
MITVLTKIEEVENFVYAQKSAGRTIGFVPTMGALHKGHLSLVKKALDECDVCIVSIFVNPTQFNDPKDLETYPRTFQADADLLEDVGAHAIFHPEVETIYPEKDDRIFDVGAVAEVMEGKHRPGHFNGVMQVVSRLFEIVKPDKAFFGEKDFQQIAVIKAMVNQMRSSVRIVACPIIREEDGLALSSRNVRLSHDLRCKAPHIHQILQQSTSWAHNMKPQQVKDKVVEELNKINSLEVEYYDIVDGDTLQSIKEWNESQNIMGCITVYCGEVRLIDNIHYSN